MPDGNVEYIGRNDFQVKIRGHRIELGEIENVLLGFKGIAQATVLSRSRGGKESGNKYLVGYYVAEPNLSDELDEEKIFAYLESKLPEYMIPSTLMRLESLPLTVNGKLDRRALPDPDFTDKDKYVAPTSELEKKLCSIWGEVLHLDSDKIGVRDSFFRLGGNSILAIKLVSLINIELEKTINLQRSKRRSRIR